MPRFPALARTGRSLADINITPFVDVVLVLLIIFMITAPILQSGIEVELPKTKTVKAIVEERLVVTIDRGQRYAYVCLGKTVGFDVVDLKAGRVVHRVLAGESPIRHRTHGAGLTPDETEHWISDQQGKRLFVFDATRMPPTPKGYVPLMWEGHGWVCFSLDGRYAWCHTPEVYDVRAKERIALLKEA